MEFQPILQTSSINWAHARDSKRQRMLVVQAETFITVHSSESLHFRCQLVNFFKKILISVNVAAEKRKIHDAFSVE